MKNFNVADVRRSTIWLTIITWKLNEHFARICVLRFCSQFGDISRSSQISSPSILHSLFRWLRGTIVDPPFVENFMWKVKDKWSHWVSNLLFRSSSEVFVENSKLSVSWKNDLIDSISCNVFLVPKRSVRLEHSFGLFFLVFLQRKFLYDLERCFFRWRTD